LLMSLSASLAFPRLAEALRVWLDSACPFIAAMNGYRVNCDEFVVQSGENRFERVYRQRTTYRVDAVMRALALPQASEIDRALRDEPDLRAIRNRFLGCRFDLFHMTAH